MDECDSCGTVSRTVALYEFALGPEWEDYGKQYMWCPGCKDDDYIKVVIKSSVTIARGTNGRASN